MGRTTRKTQEQTQLLVPVMENLSTQFGMPYSEDDIELFALEPRDYVFVWQRDAPKRHGIPKKCGKSGYKDEFRLGVGAEPPSSCHEDSWKIIVAINMVYRYPIGSGTAEGSGSKGLYEL